ncbi:exonuclease subunit SbcD [Marinomonas algarum]|uniref:Nuclease SbcCD subunit D n=1 Tax=Marinomonas algarum TaxID=2883105 RepID=A0A9X1IMK7_9GAMM|nr:exonuclease subunit SbcD [Marinomonas algarum]MCB5160523.1 exonuclease subunit SbcD [Marinomonas algarum]
MKILHTSDWHLGQHFMGKSRQAEHKAFIEWLLALIDAEAIDAVIIAGDIFDTGSPPSYAREMYHQLVLDMTARHCQLIVVAGNHDSVSMLNESKSLLTYLEAHVSSQANIDEIASHVVALRNKQGEQAAWLCAVPYLRPKDVVTSVAGQSEQDKKQSLLQQIQGFYNGVFQAAREKNRHLDRPLPILGTGHLTAVGSQSSESVRDLYVGTLEALPANVFPMFDYLALGHIHRAQAISKEGRYRYSGSPIPLSFDELNREKTVTIIDTVLLAKFTFAEDLFAKPEKPLRFVSIPRFQAMQSLTGSLGELTTQIDQLDVPDNQTLWLEVTVVANDYLSDVHKRLLETIEGKPIELLRVMRKSSQEKKQAAFAERQTLAELTVNDVFEQSLATQADINENDKSILTALFNQCVFELDEANHAQESNQ